WEVSRVFSRRRRASARGQYQMARAGQRISHHLFAATSTRSTPLSERRRRALPSPLPPWPLRSSPSALAEAAPPPATDLQPAARRLPVPKASVFAIPRAIVKAATP